ncbi:hypothetical protein Tco_0252622 [Tanacetum coccineum]
MKRQELTQTILWIQDQQILEDVDQMCMMCRIMTFMIGKPYTFTGTEGVVGLKRWFEKIEQVFEICKCAEDDKVKFAYPWSHVKARMILNTASNLQSKDGAKNFEKGLKVHSGFPEGIKGNVTSSKPANFAMNAIPWLENDELAGNTITAVLNRDKKAHLQQVRGPPRFKEPKLWKPSVKDTEDVVMVACLSRMEGKPIKTLTTWRMFNQCFVFIPLGNSRL